MFNGSIGPLELVVVLVIVLLIFGPKRLPGLGKQLGRGMREFKDSITGSDRDEDKDEAGERPVVTPAATTDETATQTQSAAAEALGTKPSGRSGGAA